MNYFMGGMQLILINGLMGISSVPCVNIFLAIFNYNLAKVSKMIILRLLFIKRIFTSFLSVHGI